MRGTVPDLRVDANRDGVVDLSGSSDERLEDSREALFLANLDDDTRRCLLPENLVSLDDPAYDQKRAACNDAADNIVNGLFDERDLASIHALPMRDAPEGARIAISGAPDGSVRLFMRDSGQLRTFDPSTEPVPAQALRDGLELRLEGRDIIRDTRWNGTVRVTLSLPDGKSDTVALRQAPLLLQHTLQTSSQVILAARPKLLSKDEFEKDPILGFTYEDYLEFQKPLIPAHKSFRDTLDAARQSAEVDKPLRQLPIDKADMWMQDMFEPAYMSVPGQDGNPHIIRVLLRSPDLARPGSRVVFELRRRDVAVVQQAQDPFEYPPLWTATSIGWAISMPCHPTRPTANTIRMAAS
ncbi:protein-arginine deiminase family protein [Methylocucumis oryzae]|uniref:protein-arginine deiminase family protein n=1 Tax=Methylocucumis oryzae TaxID=1632867 RepID=UPI0019553D10|nr:protein-arginine deiminase family protein [Methylocucumis oryzae]